MDIEATRERETRPKLDQVDRGDKDEPAGLDGDEIEDGIEDGHGLGLDAGLVPVLVRVAHVGHSLGLVAGPVPILVGVAE